MYLFFRRRWTSFPLIAATLSFLARGPGYGGCGLVGVLLVAGDRIFVLT